MNAASAVPAPLVALVGNPNCGKTALFNVLTGNRQKVANYAGVTVERKEGFLRTPSGKRVRILDLPGAYSLDPLTPDERVTADVLFGRRAGEASPDFVVCVTDATNLRQNLRLVLCLKRLGLPMVIALNMTDLARRRGLAIDAGRLREELGVPVVETVGVKASGAVALVSVLDQVAAPAEKRRPAEWLTPSASDIARDQSEVLRILRAVGADRLDGITFSDRIDSVVLHPAAGPLILALILFLVFQAVFAWAQVPMDAIKSGVGLFGDWVARALPATLFRDLLVNGVIAGVGSVLVFLPQILLLFLFIGVLEDSGYLARAALIADRTMARVGLQGKSFIPLLSAYACAVPAIMATRTIENKRDRIATILIAPFMTCSARLPVYTLIIAAFIPERPFIGPFLGTRAAAMLGLYVLGFVAAVATARLLKSSILRSERTPFVLEMPAYRRPTLRSLGLRVADRAEVFLKRAGTVILGVSFLLWLLASVPLIHGHTPPIEQSLAGTLGRTIEPAIRPLGFNWKIGIGLISSLAAREVIVGTLGTIYGMEPGKDQVGLQQALQHDLSPAGAVSLLVFFAFAMQCMSTLAVVRRETGSWKWPVIQFTYMGALAYVSSFVVYHLLS